MTDIDIDCENYKVSLSLGKESLYISVLNNVSYDLYSLDVNQLIFNDNRIKFSNLFNLIKAGLNKSDNGIYIKMETLTKIMNFKIDVNTDYITFSHTFELVKQESGSIDLKEIKKSIVLLNNKFSPLDEMLDKIWERNIQLPDIEKYKDLILCLDKEFKTFRPTEGNKTYYSHITSEPLISILVKYKGSVSQITNLPHLHSDNQYNPPKWVANGGSLIFQNGKLYDLVKDLKILLNYKKINIIYHEFDNKWYITFLILPYLG